MENFKQYLPWIIGAAIVLFILSRLRSRSVLAPTTQITQTPQPDPYANDRITAFTSLIGLAESETQARQSVTEAATAKDIALREFDITSRNLEIGRELSLRAFDIDLAKSNAYLDALREEINLGFLQRSQDRLAQEKAIQRYYSSRTTSDIIGSISGALGNIFGNRGTIIGTPPTFPRSGFSFGF